MELHEKNPDADFVLFGRKTPIK